VTLSYDITESYQFNYDRGPAFAGPWPEVPSTPLKEFLGLKVRSRLGIAAGLLLNSKWTSVYARLGFDLLTYKTVRAVFRPCYPPPNWVFVDDRATGDGPVYTTSFDPARSENATSAVCFGMPSMSPDVWRKDVREAKNCLSPGQILIVSVVATPDQRASADGVAEDFARCAAWASEAGADIIEANFSCPNVCSAEGSIYLDPKLSRAIARRIRDAIGSKPLVIKVGDFGSSERMEAFLQAVAGMAQAVTLVNCIVRPVLHRDDQPVFGEQFRAVGVAGRAIHEPSLALVRDAVHLVARHRLELAIIAVGGVSRLNDMEDFFSAGAAAVLMGSAPMYLPELAVAARRLHPEW
jgi:dihydroorotate dehydrogenase (NAD+) catalytic subunit